MVQFCFVEIDRKVFSSVMVITSSGVEGLGRLAGRLSVCPCFVVPRLLTLPHGAGVGFDL